jgi:hypothetical protein
MIKQKNLYAFGISLKSSRCVAGKASILATLWKEAAGMMLFILFTLRICVKVVPIVLMRRRRIGLENSTSEEELHFLPELGSSEAWTPGKIAA